MTDEGEARDLKWFSDTFFPLMGIFYHYLFRTKKSLEVSIDWLKGPKYCQGQTIKLYARQLLDTRKSMCKSCLPVTPSQGHNKLIGISTCSAGIED